jgi:tRNA pseudouridine13 synthase
VDELPSYEASGSGEHLYVQIETEGLTTDAAASALARACAVPLSAVGFAGRKDRHAVTRQWFSVLRADESQLDSLTTREPSRRIEVVQVSHHRNKLRLGHLAGNRFRLRIDVVAGAEPELQRRIKELATGGLQNRFGVQRFGLRGSNLPIARAWGAGDLESAVALVIDPDGGWAFGDALPERAGGFTRRAVEALRRKPVAAAALRAAGSGFRKLIASAAQSAIFNAVLDARAREGLLYTLRVDDMGVAPSGAPFRCRPEELDDTNRRAAPGVLEAFASGPLPGTKRYAAGPGPDREERAWSASTGIDWSWLDRGGPLQSPGARRPLIARCLEPPELSSDWLTFALPKGSYATELLEQLGIAVPENRRST